MTHTDNLVNLSFLFFVLFCFACVCFFYLFCFSWWKSHCWTWDRRIIDFLVIIRYLYSALMNWGLYGLVDWSLMQKLLFSPEFYDFLFILFKREIPPPSLWDIWLLKDCNSIPKWYIYIYSVQRFTWCHTSLILLSALSTLIAFNDLQDYRSNPRN